MKFYDTSIPIYVETDASGICLEAGLLQVRGRMNCRCKDVSDNVILHPIAFASKSLLNTEWCYRTIEWESLGILHGVKKFHH